MVNCIQLSMHCEAKIIIQYSTFISTFDIVYRTVSVRGTNFSEYKTVCIKIAVKLL